MKIGIPQALTYHYYQTLWTTFFNDLSCEVITSGRTDRSKLDSGINIAPGETCLPLKCYLGHVLSLRDKADLIFIPRLACLSRQRGIKLGCPKMIGLPDMIKALVPEAPILTIDVDLRLENEEVSYGRIARQLGIPEHRARFAYRHGIDRSQEHKKERIEAAQVCREAQDDLTIGLIGHAYLLEDDFLNLHLKNKILEAGAQIIDCHDLPDEHDEPVKNIIKPLSWYFENHILNAASFFYDDNNISGIIYLCSFGCGAASITHEIIELEIAPDNPTHFLKIVLDEHTGEAGIMTRIESFIDMINLKRARKL